MLPIENIPRPKVKPGDWGPLRRRYEELLERRRCEEFVEREAQEDQKRGKDAAVND